VSAEEAAKKEKEDAEKREKKRLLRIANELKLAVEQEDREYHKFQGERERIIYFWMVERKKLNEKEADLRNKNREYEDLKVRQAIELKMFQQRLKHLRYHHQDETVELKTEAELALKLQEDHHRVTEAEINKDKRSLKVEMKEGVVAQEEYIRMLKLEQDQKVLELRQEYDRKARDMQLKYDLRMKTIREEMHQKRRSQITKIEEAKTAHIQRVMAKNAKDFMDIRVYYKDITESNLDSIRHLRDDHQLLKKNEIADSKKMHELDQRNRGLREPFNKAKQDVERLEEQLRAYQEDKKKLAAVKDKIKQSETQLHRMDFQNEVLQQQLAEVSKERDGLYSKFQQAIYEVQQKSGLKNLIVEKKIATVEEALETTEAQVSELRAHVDQATATGIAQKLDEVIGYKNDIVGQLEEEVQRIKDSHQTMVRTYESKLAEYGIPSEELGFVPAIN